MGGTKTGCCQAGGQQAGDKGDGGGRTLDQIHRISGKTVGPDSSKKPWPGVYRMHPSITFSLRLRYHLVVGPGKGADSARFAR
jgi:hypothetical protein